MYYIYVFYYIYNIHNILHIIYMLYIINIILYIYTNIIYIYIYIYIVYIIYIYMLYNIISYKWPTTHRVLKSHKRKMGVIYMQSWKYCALPVITTMAWCAQVHELPQSHCGDNREGEGTFFSWLHRYIYYIIYDIYIYVCVYIYIYIYI